VITRIKGQNHDIQIQKLVKLRQYIKFGKCVAPSVHNILPTTSKNVTVQKLILFFCCMGMKLALLFCKRVKENKLLHSCMQTATTSETWCHHPIRRLPVCDDCNEVAMSFLQRKSHAVLGYNAASNKPE